MSDTARYSGLVKIAFHKQAILEGWDEFTRNRPGWTTAAYLTPFVGTGASLLDATHAFSKGNVLSGIGNSLFALASLIPGAGLLKGLGRGALAARAGIAGSRLGKGSKLLGAMERFGKSRNMLGRITTHLPSMGDAAGSARFWSHVPGIGRLANRGEDLISAGRTLQRLPGPLGGFRGMAAGMGMSVAGDLLNNPGSRKLPDLDAMGDLSGASTRHAVPFGTGGLFDRELPPTRGMSLRYFNPFADPNTLPFSGTLGPG